MHSEIACQIEKSYSSQKASSREVLLDNPSHPVSSGPPIRGRGAHGVELGALKTIGSSQSKHAVGAFGNQHPSRTSTRQVYRPHLFPLLPSRARSPTKDILTQIMSQQAQQAYEISSPLQMVSGDWQTGPPPAHAVCRSSHPTGLSTHCCIKLYLMRVSSSDAGQVRLAV